MAVVGEMEIRRAMVRGTIKVEGGPSEPVIGPNGVDVHLAPELVIYNLSPYGFLDPLNLPELVPVPVVEKYGGWLLEPNQLYLGRTQEYTETHGYVPDCNGRSSIGRLGVFIHATAGWGDDGFCGHWTLEITVARRVILRPGMRIGQLRYHEIRGMGQGYQGRYQGSKGIIGSRYSEGE
jgi:dCTP deaminase